MQYLFQLGRTPSCLAKHVSSAQSWKLRKEISIINYTWNLLKNNNSKKFSHTNRHVL